jgi:GNAT superfamily N-acetyltransferase
MKEKVAEGSRRTHDITVQRDSFVHLDAVRDLNRRVFGEERLINRLDHDPLIFLTAHCNGRLAGFKIGYSLNRRVFYSAKSATDPDFRRCGVAGALMDAMIHDALVLGFRELQYDTFPARWPGMVVIGLKYGFRIKNLQWNADYGDFQVRLARELRIPGLR